MHYFAFLLSPVCVSSFLLTPDPEGVGISFSTLALLIFSFIPPVKALFKTLSPGDGFGLKPLPLNPSLGVVGVRNLLLASLISPLKRSIMFYKSYNPSHAQFEKRSQTLTKKSDWTDFNVGPPYLHVSLFFTSLEKLPKHLHASDSLLGTHIYIFLTFLFFLGGGVK